MKMQQVSERCYAALNETNLVCDANYGLVNLGGGLTYEAIGPCRGEPALPSAVVDAQVHK